MGAYEIIPAIPFADTQPRLSIPVVVKPFPCDGCKFVQHCAKAADDCAAYKAYCAKTAEPGPWCEDQRIPWTFASQPVLPASIFSGPRHRSVLSIIKAGVGGISEQDIYDRSKASGDFRSEKKILGVIYELKRARYIHKNFESRWLAR